MVWLQATARPGPLVLIGLVLALFAAPSSSSTAHLASAHMAFQRVGTLHSLGGYVQLTLIFRLPFPRICKNVHKVMPQPHQIQQTSLNKPYFINHVNQFRHIQRQMSNAYLTLTDACNMFKEWADPETYLGSLRKSPRQDRAAVAFIGGLIGGMIFLPLLHLLFSSPVANVPIHTHFQKSLADDLHATAFLEDRLARLATQAYTWEEANRVAIQMNVESLRLRDNANYLKSIIDDALQQRLTPRMVDPQDLLSAFAEVQDIAVKHALHVAIPTAADLYSLPIQATLHRGSLVARVLVPLTIEQMPLFQFLGTPLVSNATHRPLIVPQPAQTVIAVSRTSTNYVTSTIAHLSKACVTIQTHYLCPDLVTRLARTEDCLAGLFSADVATVTRHCPMRTLSQSWHVSKAGPGKWAITTNTTLSGSAACSNGTSYTVRFPVGQTIASLDPGCHLQTRHFKLHTAAGSFANVRLATALSIMVPDNITFAPLQPAFATLNHQVDHLVHETQTLQPPTEEYQEHSPLALAAYTAVVVLFTIVASLVLKLYCRGGPQPAQAPASAPNQPAITYNAAPPAVVIPTAAISTADATTTYKPQFFA